MVTVTASLMSAIITVSIICYSPGKKITMLIRNLGGQKMVGWRFLGADRKKNLSTGNSTSSKKKQTPFFKNEGEYEQKVRESMTTDLPCNNAKWSLSGRNERTLDSNQTVNSKLYTEKRSLEDSSTVFCICNSTFYFLQDFKDKYSQNYKCKKIK